MENILGQNELVRGRHVDTDEAFESLVERSIEGKGH